MTDVCASLGLPQLEKLNKFNEERNQIAQSYTNGLLKYSEFLKLPITPSGYYHSFYGYPITLTENCNFTRKELAKAVYQNLGFSKNLSSIFIDDFFEVLITELIKKKKIKISAFGTFKILDKKQRIGRNPKTKVLATISPRKVVSFKPSSLLKNKINKL